MSTTDRTDAELVARTRAGDVSAFGELYERRWETVYQAARGVTRSDDEALDVTSKVFADVLERAQSGQLVPNQPSLRPYLRTAAKHSALDAVRHSAKLRPTDRTEVLEAPVAADQDAGSVQRPGDLVSLFRAFLSLSDEDQSVLRNRVVRRVPPRELARATGVAANTISQSATRAMARLRKAYFRECRAANRAATGCPWSDHVVALVVNDLPDAQKASAADHVAQCPTCAGLQVEMEEVPSRLRVIGLPVLLGLDRDRFRLSLTAAATTEDARVPDEGAHEEAIPPAGDVAVPPRARFNAAPSSRVVKLLAGPAVLLFVVGAMTAGLRGTEEHPGNVTTADAAPTPLRVAPTTRGAEPGTTASAPSTTIATPSSTAPVPPPRRFAVATARVAQVPVYAAPGGQEPTATLANPTDLGAPLVFLSKSVTDNWVEVHLPLRPNGSTGWVRRGDVELTVTPYYVRIELRAARITLWENSTVVIQEPAAVGLPHEPTAPGLFYITAAVVPSGPPGTIGQCVRASSPDVVLVLSGYHLNPPACAMPQVAITTIENRSGSARFDAQLGTQSTHGDVRISSSALTRIGDTVPLGTPVEIVE